MGVSVVKGNIGHEIKKLSRIFLFNFNTAKFFLQTACEKTVIPSMFDIVNRTKYLEPTGEAGAM